MANQECTFYATVGLKSSLQAKGWMPPRAVVGDSFAAKSLETAEEGCTCVGLDLSVAEDVKEEIKDTRICEQTVTGKNTYKIFTTKTMK